MTMEHRRGGDLYFKSGKEACIAHIFLFVTGKSFKKKSSKIEKKKKEKKERKKNH